MLGRRKTATKWDNYDSELRHIDSWMVDNSGSRLGTEWAGLLAASKMHEALPPGDVLIRKGESLIFLSLSLYLGGRQEARRLAKYGETKDFVSVFFLYALF